MKIVPFVNDIAEYLKKDESIDYDNESISALSAELWKNASGKIDYIKAAYEYVRDCIAHSADINADLLISKASDVLRVRHGICFAKSSLFISLLRCKSIPAGYCYQRLTLNEENSSILIYHGLTGVYIEELNKWIRLDARGNKEGVNAQFSIDKEQLAFPVRAEFGEKDIFTVYPEQDVAIMKRFKQFKTRTELWSNLPTELAYDNSVNL